MSPSGAGTAGRVLHSARAYDFVAWVLTLGKERRFREHLVDLARLSVGESVLDVGCGTGSLAIAANSRVGSTGQVCGVDPSPEMIARVLKPGGRFLAVDLGGADGRRPGLHARLRGHGHFDVDELTPQLEAAGLPVVERGPLGFPRLVGLSNLRFLLAMPPAQQPGSSGRVASP